MDRRNEILKAIVKHFIDTAEPVGSQTLVVSYDFRVSPATIRNDMATLERDGFIEQPHISAGRIPTDLGYRLYVDELSDVAAAEKEAEKVFIKTLERFNVEKVRNKLYDAVSLIADATNNVSFATVPDNPRTFYLGISNVMRQPEFMKVTIL
jgi:heat-inducible transcriptional repressor